MIELEPNKINCGSINRMKVSFFHTRILSVNPNETSQQLASSRTTY